MIDKSTRKQLAERKERVRRRINTKVDPENYEFIPAKKPIDYYDNDIRQRIAVYARVSTDNVQQTSSYTTIELCWQYGHLIYRGFCAAIASRARIILPNISAEGSVMRMFLLMPTPPVDQQTLHTGVLPDTQAAGAELRRQTWTRQELDREVKVPACPHMKTSLHS